MIDLYGWSDKLRQDFEVYAAKGWSPARIVVQRRGLYRIVCEAGELNAEISGRFAHDVGDGLFPVTGDWVAVALRPEEGAATIHAVLPRSSAFTRKAAGKAGHPQVVAANTEVALLTASLNDDLNLRRLERYLATAWESGATPLVVLTKADLCDNVAALVASVKAVAIGVGVHAVSAVTGQGLEAVAAAIGPGRTAVLLGSSGVGKSTLVNALAGADVMATQAIRETDGRGRHTTTHREIIRLPSGALLLDTPGMREFGLWEADDGVAAVFADVEALATACRFTNCTHANEPGCAVQAALADGTLDAERWRSYGKLQRELAHEERKGDYFARQAQKKVWAGRHKAYRALVKAREQD